MTKIRDTEGKFVQKIVGLDANSLYLHALSQASHYFKRLQLSLWLNINYWVEHKTTTVHIKPLVIITLFITQPMPCGMYIRRRESTNFYKEYPTAISKASTDWLAYVEESEGISIQHNRNDVEYRVGLRKIPVDGYHVDSNTVFQFNGCHWHGCPR